ncbi:C1 family peptidase [Flavivirga spongiicola]|uniref:Aminopeptidase n=1 Tax=Flavivirga spongiicola TaxID=421621 RepID=A0ABU7XZS7_9FLAO|nr:C1 family peptidase [Flavivirga sp. MEBiC05379]MDO5980359.1 C1 family peptidase [Flavivirga sp. MEBiC05379]
MKNKFLASVFTFFTLFIYSQSYDFKTIIDLDATDVISQDNTGTCWSFSTSSFLESEIIRLTGQKIDLSEMYNVRHTYLNKSWNYVMRQGKTQFSQGGLAHDVINSISEHGFVPNDLYTGLTNGNKKHNHSKLVDTLKKTLDRYIKEPKTYNWKKETNEILDTYLGNNIESFDYNGTKYTPLSFMRKAQIDPKNYVTITSFSHKPYHTNFILNIPDNFSNGTFFNVKLDELVHIVNNALKEGFTVELDCDVSEKTFSSKHGLAIISEDGVNIEDALVNVSKEKEITQEFRQQEFENYNTTDDHLMHITGLLKDQNGTTYYKVKNSWGTNPKRVSNGGYIYMSEAYLKLKTISIMLNKKALPKKILKILRKAQTF